LPYSLSKINLIPSSRYYLNKRSMVETIIDQLKHILHIDHSRDRSMMNFQINVLRGLLAYVFKPKKVTVPFHSLSSLLENNQPLIQN